MLVEKGLDTRKVQALLNLAISLPCLIAIIIGSIAYVVLATPSWDPKMLSGSRSKGHAGKLLNQPLAFFDRGKKSFELPWPDLSEVTLLEYTPRPDSKGREGCILLSINGEKRLVSEGQRVLLGEKAPFWVEAHRTEALCCMQFVNKQGEVVIEQKRRLLWQEPKTVEGNIPELQMLKFCEPDQVLKVYGGKNFEGLKPLYRMHNGKSIQFVKAGDQFSWVDGAWKAASGDTAGHPLMLIRTLDGQKCELTVWDAEGLYGKTLSLPLSKSAQASAKIQELLGKIYLRSDTSVTCQLQKRSTILRSGDWLLYTQGSVRKLRTQEEIKDFLRYALKGELFIFDGIVKKEQGTMLVGHLFNEERTQSRTVEFVLSERRGKR